VGETNQPNKKTFKKQGSIGMITSNEAFKPSVSYEDTLHERLSDPSYAGHYLAAAYEEEPEYPGVLEQAVEQVIKATSPHSPALAIAAIPLTLERLNVRALLRLMALLEDTLQPDIMNMLTRQGLSHLIQDLALIMSEVDDEPFEYVGFTCAETVPTAQMKKAFSSIAAA